MSNIAWKTMDGRVLEFTEMTDSHLENAINYCMKKEGVSVRNSEAIIRSLYYLREEKERRGIQKKKDDARQECPFCKNGIMELVESEYNDPYPDVGFGLPEYSHRLICPNCGALGPKNPGRI